MTRRHPGPALVIATLLPSLSGCVRTSTGQGASGDPSRARGHALLRVEGVEA